MLRAMLPAPARPCPLPPKPSLNAAVLVLGSLLGVSIASAPAQAQDAFAGTWRIVEAEAAPWAGQASAPDAKAMKELKGKTVTFAAAKVSGPKALACAKPRYEIGAVPPEGLFQGTLAAPPRPAQPPANAADAARRLGMTTPTVPTLSTGCAEIPFHLVGPNEALFALNNVVYRMRK